MLNIGNFNKKEFDFELVILVRDRNGNPTGKKKYFGTNSPEELETIWIRNSMKKKKKKKGGAAKTEKEIKVAIQEASAHIEKIRKSRKLED